MVSVLFSLLVSLAALVVVDAVPVRRGGSFPDYVLKYAPLSHLHSKEEYWPSDIAVHLPKLIPEVNFKSVGGTPTLQTLSALGNDVYLTAVDEDALAHDSPYFTSVVGKPVDGASAAPATIIAVEKSEGIVDAFYFYFYTYNYGNAVLGLRFGNHVGDWEHTMVRFINGTPSVVYYSQHSSGAAYTYSAAEKIGVRPVSYTGIGTHANYPTAGEHDYTLPLGLLSDQTDEGPIWDVTKNFRGFWYDPSTGGLSLAPGAGSGGTVQYSEGTSWLNFGGGWGDEQWPTNKFGQYCLGEECHITSGPTGPLAKNLGRTAVCQNENPCTIQTTLPKQSQS
jgi:hypothetical protein